MNMFLWIAIAIGVVLAAAPHHGVRKVNEKQLAKLVRRKGLPLPPPFRQPVLTRLHSRERSALIWGLSGVGVGTLAAVLMHLVTGADTLASLLIMVAAALGLALIVTLSVWVLVPIKPPGGWFAPVLAVLGAIAVLGVCWPLDRVAAGAETLTMVLGLLTFGVGVACWALLLIPWLSGHPSLRLWSGSRFQGA